MVTSCPDEGQVKVMDFGLTAKAGLQHYKSGEQPNFVTP